jgi:hypothetical protein
MFSSTSRYAGQPEEVVTDAMGRSVSAITLRRLPPTPGRAHQTTDIDRLDLLAYTHASDPTRGWYIADANTALDAARELDGVATRSVKLPQQA